MLLPILILQPNFKETLCGLIALVSKQELARQLWNLVNRTTTQLLFLYLIATTITKTYYISRWLPQSIPDNLTEKPYYVFVDHQQTHQDFFQQMNRAEQNALLQELKFDYQEILISYFTTDRTLKGKIDKFINAVFCANIPVPQIIEMHMEVIDEFSKQLRLEGRSDETLLDYRLTLIDILAHLCETYRCSIYK